MTFKDIYEQVIAMEPVQIEILKKDVMDKYKSSMEDFADVSGEEKEFLQTFSFICKLTFDVYIKKLMIEKILDEYSRKHGVVSEEKGKKKTSSKAEE